MPQQLLVLSATSLVLRIFGWIHAHAGLVVIGVLGTGLYSWWKARGRGEIQVQRPERPDPGDVSRLGLEARGRTGSGWLCRSQAVDSLRKWGIELVSGLMILALADASMLHLAVEWQPPSPSEATKRATDWRGGSERPLEERIEEFNQTPLLEEPPLCARSSPRSQESPPTSFDLHPNGASQALYQVKGRSGSLDVGEGHDGCS